MEMIHRLVYTHWCNLVGLLHFQLVLSWIFGVNSPFTNTPQEHPNAPLSKILPLFSERRPERRTGACDSSTEFEILDHQIWFHSDKRTHASQQPKATGNWSSPFKGRSKPLSDTERRIVAKLLCRGCVPERRASSLTLTVQWARTG